MKAAPSAEETGSATAACVGCGGGRLRSVRRYRTQTPHGKRLFGTSWLNACEDCGLVQTVPLPDLEPLSAYYAVDYRENCCAGRDVTDLSRFPRDNLFYFNRGRSIVELVAPHVSSRRPRVLDVGAGFGHILDAFGDRFPGCERMAIEFSQVCVEHLRSLGIEVHDEPAEELLPKLETRFDVVVISHVFEHLREPRRMLEIVRERLAPDGVLYVEVPNIPEDADRRFPDHVWAPRFDEPHLTFFSLETLRGLLERSGLDVVFAEAAGPKYRYVSALRYRMPTMRWWIQDLVPPPVFRFLRRQTLTAPLRMREREDSFFEYGGGRIWLRTLSRARN